MNQPAQLTEEATHIISCGLKAACVVGPLQLSKYVIIDVGFILILKGSRDGALLHKLAGKGWHIKRECHVSSV